MFSKIKKIIYVILLYSIVLCTSSISYAFDLDVNYIEDSGSSSFSVSSVAGYSYSQINNICRNKSTNSDNGAFDTMISSLSSLGYTNYLVVSNSSNSGFVFFDDTCDVGYSYYNDSDFFVRITCSSDSLILIHSLGSSYMYNPARSSSLSTICFNVATYTASSYSIYKNDDFSIKSLSRSIVSGKWCCSWSGEYISSPGGDEELIIPSNSEIASAVQAFYNSDIYKNQSYFKDFFVVYSYKTGVYTFIGHNLETNLGQRIYSETYKKNTLGFRYWNFFLRNIGSHIWNFFNNYYWVSFSYDGENFTEFEKGYTTDLLEVNFDSRISTIIYSTTDYLCVLLDSDENGLLIEEETNIQGNQFTYNENLDPTENKYNPIQDFIPSDPTQTALEGIDTSRFYEIIEQYNDFFTTGRGLWIFTALSLIFGTFTDFIVVCAVLVFIARMLKGD